MQQKSYKYLFGPVSSRRLGISLGVDLMPRKTCSLDCVYCESGKTTHLTSEVKEYIPVEAVKEELTRYLKANSELDCITFSGFGEPTLHSGIGEIISFIKENHPGYRVVLLTNSTLFAREEVRNAVIGADLIVASLDAVSVTSFQVINRPASGIDPDSMVDGLVKLRSEYGGELWIEVFIVPGKNDSPAELEKIRSACALIRPDKIQVNSLDRPGTEDWVQPVDERQLSDLARRVDLGEAIKRPEAAAMVETDIFDIRERILFTVRRRPSTSADISKSLCVKESLVVKTLAGLVTDREVEKVVMPRGVFYKCMG